MQISKYSSNAFVIGLPISSGWGVLMFVEDLRTTNILGDVNFMTSSLPWKFLSYLEKIKLIKPLKMLPALLKTRGRLIELNISENYVGTTIFSLGFKIVSPLSVLVKTDDVGSYLKVM
ncbi:hypothetical protein L195_g034134, partial [Trifolium pratense]